MSEIRDTRYAPRYFESWVMDAWVRHLRSEHGVVLLDSDTELPAPVGSCTCVNGKGGHVVTSEGAASD